jgi:tetratricopeptide (TPR) repeat protein
MRTFAVAIAALLLLGGVAHAVGDKHAAAAHFQKGRALFDANNFAAALSEFQAGYDAYPLSGFLVNIGQCQRKLDRLDEASAAFQHYLDSENTEPKLRAEVQEALAEITAERDRRLAADIEARRQRDEAERNHPLDDEPARPMARAATPRPLPAAAMPAAAMPAVATTASAPAVEPHAQKGGKKWVWAVVGVLAVGVAASAVAVGVVETQPPAAHAGSLGLLDGRR